MAEQSKSLNKWVAVGLIIVVFIIVGAANNGFVLKQFGDLGGVLMDVLGLIAAVMIWKKTSKPKVVK